MIGQVLCFLVFIKLDQTLLLFKRYKRNGHVVVFHQLAHKLGHSEKQVLSSTSTLQEIQNDWSCFVFLSTGSNARVF